MRQRCVWSSSRHIPAHLPLWRTMAPLKLLDCQNKSERYMNGGCTPQPSLWPPPSTLNLVCVGLAEILQLCDFNAAVRLLWWALGSTTSKLGRSKRKRAAPRSHIWPASFSWRCGRWVTMEITPRLWRSGWSRWSWETTPSLSSSMATPPWSWWRRSGRSSSSTWVLFLNPSVWYFKPPKG